MSKFGREEEGGRRGEGGQAGGGACMRARGRTFRPKGRRGRVGGGWSEEEVAVQGEE